jgi:hypothetical protein
LKCDKYRVIDRWYKIFLSKEDKWYKFFSESHLVIFLRWWIGEIECLLESNIFNHCFCLKIVPEAAPAWGCRNSSKPSTISHFGDVSFTERDNQNKWTVIPFITSVPYRNNWTCIKLTTSLSLNGWK